MGVIVLEWHLFNGFADLYCPGVGYKADVFHIASAEVDDVGGRADKSRKKDWGVLSRNAILLHGKQ